MLLGNRKKRGREGTDLTSSLIWERCKCRLQQGEEKKRKPLHNVTTISLFPSFTFPFQTFSPSRYIHRFRIYFQASFHFPLSQFSFPFILVIFTSSLHKIHKRLSSSLLCCYRRYPSQDVFLAGFFQISVFLDFLCPQPSSAGSDACKCQDYASWSSLDTVVHCSTVPPYKEWALQLKFTLHRNSHRFFVVQFH